MSDEEENELPTRPREFSLPHHSYTSLRRKRSHGYESTASSSDPVFSSDDLAEASVDNYATPRRKKQYRRTWWESDPPEPAEEQTPKQKPKPQSHMDSGVFMASDSSSTDDGFSVERLSFSDQRRPAKKLAARLSSAAGLLRSTSLQGEALARGVVETCLEDDREIVDLSTCALTCLSSETLRPLRHLIRRPKQHQTDKTGAAFQSFTPSLKIFLSCNLLRRVPGEIVNLENLSVLTVRNNKLTELPQAIGRLKNLVELNVAGNKLTSLPWELLRLVGGTGKLHLLTVFPNPLFRPFPVETSARRWQFAVNCQTAQLRLNELDAMIESSEPDADNGLERQRLAWFSATQRVLLERMSARSDDASTSTSRWNSDGTMRHESYVSWKRDPVYVASTPVTYLDFDGSASRSAEPAPSSLTADTRVLPAAASHPTARPRDCRAGCSSGVASLFELSLRTCSENVVMSDINSYLPEHTPEPIMRAFEGARAASEEGGARCSVCAKAYIIPRAEWVEYWHCAPESLHFAFEELFLPFLRRACSWACAERAFDERVIF